MEVERSEDNKAMTKSAFEEKISYLYENTDFAETIFNGLIGYAVIAADFDGTIIAYNAGAAIIYGYSHEEVVGRLSLDCIFTDEFKKTGGIDSIFEILLKNRRYPIEVENIRKSGEVFPAKMLITLVSSKDGKELGLVSIVQDLTEIKQAEDEIRQLNQFLEQKVVKRTAQLRESEERFRAVAESAGDAIICLKQPDHVYLWNRKAEELFGYSVSEVIGKSLHRLIVPERFRMDAEKGLVNFSQSGIGNVIGKQIEISALRKDGTEFPVELSVSAMKVGNEWHATGIIRDISERKKAEEKLKEYITELERFKKATIQREFRIKELKERLERVEKK